MQIGQIAGRGAARVDHHHAHLRARRPGRRQPLIQHRVAPGQIAANQNDQIGQFDIFIKARHRV